MADPRRLLLKESILTILIGLTGRRGSGKDTAAQALQGFENVKFAAPLKMMLATLLAYQGCPPLVAQRMLEGDLKEVSQPALGGNTPRHAMQTIGTEWGRVCMHPDFWTRICEARIKQFERVVVTDVRFPNEVTLIRRLGGKVYRIERPGLQSADAHPSETEIDHLVVDATIINDAPSAEAFAERFASILA